MWFTPRIVWWTDIDWAEVIELYPQGSSDQKTDEQQDPLENNWGIIFDWEFDARINLILDTVEALENSHSKDRYQVWLDWRKKHKIMEMRDTQLKDIVMSTDLSRINVNPSYFTALCWEIMERVQGNVERVL